MIMSIEAQMFEQMKTWGTLSYGPRMLPWPVPLWLVWAWADLGEWSQRRAARAQRALERA